MNELKRIKIEYPEVLKELTFCRFCNGIQVEVFLRDESDKDVVLLYLNDVKMKWCYCVNCTRLLRKNINFDYDACIKEFFKLANKINSYNNYCSEEELKILNLIKLFLEYPSNKNFKIFIDCCRNNKNGTIFGVGAVGDTVEGAERTDVGKIKKH